ncbi:MAG: hypothetical protein NC299_18320 [Lachnospiraceae bacterium]|nr:hypothetical protein [Lachnospiraceae bacterium]
MTNTETRYNYNEAIADDIREYIAENIDLDDWRGDRDGLEQKLNDDLWTVDSVTGNASGSYYCNTWKAECAIAHNWDILGEALREFGCDDVNIAEKGAEWADVTIRCYLLGAAISEVLDDLESDGEFDEDDPDEDDEDDENA